MAALRSLDHTAAAPARWAPPPLIWAMLAQLGAAAIALLNLQFADARHVVAIHPVLLHATAAPALGQAFRLPAWWLPINALFVPAALYSLSLPMPPAGFLILFAALALTYWTAYRTRVPLYLSSRRAVDRLIELLPETQPVRLVDIGCGFGGVLGVIARQRPGCTLSGWEIAPLPAWIARWRHRAAPDIAIRRRDFWRESLAPYDLVYAFLSPAPMAQLWRKVCAEMQPGTLFVSNSFAVADAVPDLILPVHGSRSRLYIWRL